MIAQYNHNVFKVEIFISNVVILIFNHLKFPMVLPKDARNVTNGRGREEREQTQCWKENIPKCSLEVGVRVTQQIKG